MYLSHRGKEKTHDLGLIPRVLHQWGRSGTQIGISNGFPCEADATGWDGEQALRMTILENDM